MKNIYLLSIGLLTTVLINAQNNNQNLEKLSSINYPVELNDIWGYATETHEYALVGLVNGFSIVDVTNAELPAKLHRIPGPNSTWRDIKTWQSYAYGVNETGEGCVIIDMTNLPETIETYNFTGDDDISFTTAHNVFVDNNGYMYIIGSNYSNGGCLIYDLNENPLEPKLIGVYDVGYVHDLYARDNLLYTFEGADLAILDISNPAEPTILGKATTYGYTHNGWVTDDGNTLFSTDETAGTWVVSWDISDPTDIKELDKWQSSPGEGVVPHNSFVLGDYVVTSYYTDGVTITDVSKPDIMVQVGNYDTSLEFSGGGFNGAWGVYPYLPSGNIIASDIEAGLFVLKPSYQKAGYLMGNVIDAETGNTIIGAKVEINEANEITDVVGVFNYGSAGSSTVDISVSKFGYEQATVENVEITQEEITEITIELKQLARVYNIEGNILDASGNQIIESGAVSLSVNEVIIDVETVNGQFKLDSLYLGKYQLFAGSWGYYPVQMEIDASHTNQKINVYLNQGVYDDFAVDYGWTTSNNSPTGQWQLTNPVGFNLFGFVTLPNADVETDFGSKCYVTGDNEEFDFVAGGQNRLISPIFDCSAMDDPIISFYSYFLNIGYYGYGSQTVDFVLSNGTETVTIDFDSSDNADLAWKYHSIQIKDSIELTANMQFSVIANGPSGYELLESGFDVFQVVDAAKIVAESSTLSDDVMQANEQNNTLNVFANDVIACNNPVVYLVSYDENVFTNTSIDEAGMLSFDVTDTATSGTYEIVYAVNCGGLDNTAARVSTTIGSTTAIPGTGTFNCD